MPVVITLTVLGGLLLALLLHGRAFVILSVVALLGAVGYLWSQPGIESKAYGLFLGLPVAVALYGTGAAFGLALRTNVHGTRSRILLAAVATLSAVVLVVVQIERERAEAEWVAQAELASRSLLANDSQVIGAVGRVENAVLLSTVITKRSELPLTGLEFSVQGSASSVRVHVKIAGKREKPDYSISVVQPR